MADMIARGLAKNAIQQAIYGNFIPSTLLDIKNATFSVGDLFISKLYNGSVWEIKSSVILEDTTITVDDELHQIVNLVGGGTGVAECKVDSILGYIRNINTNKYALTFGKIRRRKPVAIDFKGDSITFGQYTGQAGAIPTSGTATNFGDGSTHVHDQIPTTYPMYFENRLNEVYGSGVVTALNHGYSGDTVGRAYLRHRVVTNANMCIMMYGVNETLYATVNGTVPDGVLNANFSIDKFIEAYRKLIAREIIRGSGVIVVTPYRFLANTTLTASHLNQLYENATKAVCEEMGIYMVRSHEILSNYYTSAYLFDSVHLKDAGCNNLGTTLASLFIGRGFLYPEIITGERHLSCSQAVDSFEGFGLNGVILSASHTNAYSSLDYNPIDITPDTGAIYYSFYLAEDKKKYIPVGVLTNGTVKFDVDAGITQPEYKLDIESGDNVNNTTKYPSNAITITTATTLNINSPVNINNKKNFIVGKGWHTIKISVTSGTFTLSGIRFYDFDIDTQNEAYAPLTLSSNGGATTLLSNPADGVTTPIGYRIVDSVLYFRGVVKNTNYGSELILFNLPSSVYLRIPSNYTNYIFAIEGTTIQIKFNGSQIVWVANTGGDTSDTVNLAGVKIYLKN